MRRDGFTLIELLVAGAVLVIVLGTASSFFVQQSRLSQRTQAVTDMQDRLRLAMHVLTTDVVMAGAGTYVTEAGQVSRASFSNCWPADDATGTTGVPCLHLDAGDPEATRVAVAYENSLRAETSTGSGACREVRYQVRGGDLYRLESDCGLLQSVELPVVGSSDLASIAVPGIVAIDMDVQCLASGATNVFPATGCDARSMRVGIVAQTRTRYDNAAETITFSSGGKFECPADTRCGYLEQEVVMPNLRSAGGS